MGSVQVSPQSAFARFVRRAIDDARETRGWTVTDLAHHTGVGRSTVFRWLAGDWQDYPELAKVRGFCAALDLPVTAAFRALGLPDAGPVGRRRGEDTPVEADVRVILERLADPGIPAEEKHHIRDLLRYLAHRPVRRAGVGRDEGLTPRSA
ncbi:XRE family transcriptional regulator [Micromonospora fluostatini]|uniref:XRE family transcriptional regulator n=2 Tax=Micromonospora TaxID=1873 RepID=A0A136PTT0_9ACTN|nr:helix-turn-helix domain-containing protein [Micromonospora rosaria]KXK61910.1 XRE family transcriptional regulator [Micromonospora rosaria]TDB99854.1 XRE family transcriptional regulator [Micromonospora fluostatini]